METTTMNNQGSCPPVYYSVIPGEATGGGAEGFLDMFGDRQSSGDLFDLVWQGGAGGSSMEAQSAGHLPPASPVAIALPPSDDQMAAWLYPIVVRGDELVFTGHASDHPGDLAGHAAAADDLQAPPDHKREKRRRCKINEKFKTLQHLVPGCHKSNQVSTLDQTIQYMKSLQQQIQAMSFGCGGVKPAAVYPVMSPAYLPPAAAASRLMPPAAAAVQPGVVLAPPPAMVPFGPMLPLVHHHQYPAAAMASAPTLYPAAAAPNVSVVTAPGARMQNSQ
ncbi:transcription factor PIF1-like [Panicum miliaceum]|uniref:Transcription factor PIF1-like n=1 Tax=Panicum miliaceum TaxID=4540 RepID=A0A3L6SZJ0_PANMI|nr:transcription factor PIF1-like [Panicum miliaceum]